MQLEDNKNLNLRWLQAFNERDWTTEAACRAADYTAHLSGAPVPLDFDAWSGFMIEFSTAFPDAQINVEGVIAERDSTATRFTITATHGGDFQGIPATGRQVTVAGLEFNRILDGKIAEHWGQFDLVGLMQQIGAMQASV
jgi:steroid delta-isomerase-like uncharacterized protein